MFCILDFVSNGCWTLDVYSFSDFGHISITDLLYTFICLIIMADVMMGRVGDTNIFGSFRNTCIK